MKIKKYNIFLEKDNLREDEFSHLNDMLDKKNEGRWDEEDEDDEDDHLFGRPNHSSKKQDSYDEYDE